MPRLFSGKVILYFLVLHIIDLCLMPALGIYRPVLLYLWVLYVAFYFPVRDLVPAALCAGILRDLTGSQPLGVETLSLVAMANAVTFLILKFERGIFLMRFLTVIFFVFFALFFDLAMASFLAPTNQFTWHAIYTSVWVALISAAVMPVFFKMTGKWFPPETSSLKQYELFG